MEKVTLTKNVPHREVAFSGRYFSRHRDATAAVGRKPSLFENQACLTSENLVHPSMDKTRTKIGFLTSSARSRFRFRDPNKVSASAGMQSLAISFAVTNVASFFLPLEFIGEEFSRMFEETLEVDTARGIFGRRSVYKRLCRSVS